MKADSQGLATHYNFEFVLQGLKDYKTYLQFGTLFGYVVKGTSDIRSTFLTFVSASLIVPGYAIALFTPTIINELGFSAVNAQLLSVPPFVAGCITTLLVGIHSDKRQLRGPYVIGGILAGLAGCITLYTQTNPIIALLGVVGAATGIFPTIPVILAWTSSNAGGDVKRGVAIAMVVGLANTGG